MRFVRDFNEVVKSKVRDAGSQPADPGLLDALRASARF
jgi:hypothetical protein